MAAITKTQMENAARDADDLGLVANGTVNTVVTTRLGGQVDSMAKAIESIKAFNYRGAWVTGTPYAIKDVVTESGVSYVAVTAHTSGTFATDLTANKWVVHQGLTKEELNQDAGAALIGDKLPFADAIKLTQAQINRERISFTMFGAVPNGGQSTAACFAAMQKAWASALANGHDLLHPGGVYDIGDHNYPWRQTDLPDDLTELLDCQNVTIYGTGPRSVFKTSSSGGADVFQLNGVKNLHFRNLAITADLSAFLGSGSNAISITGGYDNITILDVWCDNMPSVDKGTNIDGGAGLSVQCSAATLECGSLTARIFVKGCSYAFGYQENLNTFSSKKVAVSVDIVAEDCFTAVAVSAAEATAPVTAGTHFAVRVNAMAINCQRGLALARAAGGEYCLQVSNTKSAALRRLDTNGTAWWASQTDTSALDCYGGKNLRAKVTGNAGAIDYKARIGGTASGSSGLTGATEHCHIVLDMAGTASVEAISSIDSGGNTMSSTKLEVTATTGTVPDDFYLPSRKNDIEPSALNTGSFTGTLTGVTATVTGTIKWSITDDVVVMEIPSLSGTSNTTSASITGMPAFLRPISAQSCGGTTLDNGTALYGRIIVETNGVITLYHGATSTFANSGTKGTQFSTITYRRS